MIEEKKLIEAIVEAIQDKKGKNVATVDMSGIEYAAAHAFVIATGASTMQVDALADNVREHVEETLDVRPFNYDGYQNSQWIVLDYGTTYVHIFLPEERERYNLEQLWSDAKVEYLPDEE